MRLYYIDESEGPRYYVRSALGVDSDKWNDLCTDIHAWRLELRDRYGIPLDRELHACDLLAGRGLLAKNGDANERLSPQHGAEVFLSGLRRLEAAARNLGGIEVINVCLHKPRSRNHEQASLNRLLNRINTSVSAAERHAFLIFDEGREEMISRLYRRLKVRNQVPRPVDPVLGLPRCPRSRSRPPGPLPPSRCRRSPGRRQPRAAQWRSRPSCQLPPKD